MTYWDAFYEKYESQINSKPIIIVLEAFWNYCHSYNERCAELMGEEDVKE